MQCLQCLQSDPSSDLHAWPQAIAALLKAVEADSNNLEALLELGVSCTNELDATQALLFLQTWLHAHPVHSQVASHEVVEEHDLRFQGHVMSQFHKAAEGNEDADLYLALGVLASLIKDFEEALKCFKQALKLRPQSHSLWNKLGATSANSGRAQEALHAYNQALHLKPNYVRAWANAGIAHTQQGRHKEAAEYYLRALILNPEANHIWDHMSTNFVSMGRSDLAAKAARRDLEAFQEDFPASFEQNVPSEYSVARHPTH